MTPAEKFVSMLETNMADYMDTLKDDDGKYTATADTTKLQNIFNSTLKDFLETYLQVDIIWVGASTTVPVTPDPFVGDIGYTITFSSMNVLPLSPPVPIPPDPAVAEMTFDKWISVQLKTGMVQIPTEKLFQVTPLMLNPAGQIVTAFSTIANGQPPKDNEESRAMTKKAYKQVFDSLTMVMFNPIPSAGIHNTIYSGTMSMSNLYFKPITETSETHPETIYTVTPNHEIKFLNADTKAPSEMIDVFNKEYGYKTEELALTAANEATRTPYAYKESTIEEESTKIPREMYIDEYSGDPDFNPDVPEDQPVTVKRYFVTSISATSTMPKLYVLRTLTSEGYNVSEGSKCKVQIVFQEESENTKWDTYYKIVDVKLDDTSITGDSDLIYETGEITSNCNLTVYLETK